MKLLITFCIVALLVTIPEKRVYGIFEETDCQQEKIDANIYPIFYAILGFLGKEYLSYKLEGVFEYLEGGLSDFAKKHLKKVWITYDSMPNKKEKQKLVYLNHCNNCGICSRINRVLTKKEFRNEISRLKMEINNINLETKREITRLESHLNRELKRIDNRFTSLEENLLSVEKIAIQNRKQLKEQERNLDELSGRVYSNRKGVYKNSIEIARHDDTIGEISNRVADNSDNIDKWSKPRILILRDESYGTQKIQLLNLRYEDCEFEVRDIVFSKETTIILVNNRMIRLAESISKDLSLKIKPFKQSGLNGFSEYDIIIFL